MNTRSTIRLRPLPNGTAKRTESATPIFKVGDIIRVPYPYVEVARREVRPALVVSQAAHGLNASVVWAMMITSAANRGWPGDIDLVTDYAAYGLPVASVIRCAKISTVMVREASLVGRLSEARMDEVWQELAKTLRRPVQA